MSSHAMRNLFGAVAASIPRAILQSRRSATVVACFFLVASPSPELLAQRASVSTARTLTLREVARLGGDEDTLLVSPVRGVTRSGNAVFVLQTREAEVLIYDTLGRFQGRFGRRGSGPGEFETPYLIGWRNDSLWIADGDLRRVQFFSRNGTLIRHVKPPQPWLVRPLREGRWFVNVLDRPSDRRPLVYATDDFAVLDTIAWMAPLPIGNQLTGASGRVLYPTPLTGETAVLAIDPNGSGIFIVEPQKEPGAVRIRRINNMGRLQWEKEMAVEPVPSTREWYEAEIRSRMRGISREVAISRNALERALPRPSFLPPIASVTVTSDGGLWLRRTVAPGDPSKFLLVTADGELAGELTGPPGLRVLHVGTGSAIGVQVTELGSDVILLFRLVPAG